jgi:hypothetical protein
MPVAINNKYIIMSDNISVSDVCFVPNKLIVIPTNHYNGYPLILNAELLIQSPSLIKSFNTANL